MHFVWEKGKEVSEFHAIVIRAWKREENFCLAQKGQSWQENCINKDRDVTVHSLFRKQ